MLVIDRNLASQTGEGSISAMRYATTLIQFALGMVSAAISIASLPSLSQHFSKGDTEAYKRTLTTGLRLVTVLVLLLLLVRECDCDANGLGSFRSRGCEALMESVQLVGS